MNPEIKLADQPEAAAPSSSSDGEPAGFLTDRLAPGQISLMHAEIAPRWSAEAWIAAHRLRA